MTSALRVTCPHCGAHGEMVDMLEYVRGDTWTRNGVDASGFSRAVARFTCCGLWGDLAVAEPTPEETA